MSQREQHPDAAVREALQQSHREAMAGLLAESAQYEAAENWLYAQHVDDWMDWDLNDATEDEWDAAYRATRGNR